jgi:hypothetical protein
MPYETKLPVGHSQLKPFPAHAKHYFAPRSINSPSIEKSKPRELVGDTKTRQKNTTKLSSFY